MKDTYKKGSHEDKMLRQSIADSNKQTKGESFIQALERHKSDRDYN
jgi:hypothetical protein